MFMIQITLSYVYLICGNILATEAYQLSLPQVYKDSLGYGRTMSRYACIHNHLIHFKPNGVFNETAYKYKYVGDVPYLPILIYYTRIVQISEVRMA
jgi:hypothetical protein